MRKHATSWLIKVALFAIVIVFIFWGGYSYTERRASRIAVVNGSYIGMREYQDSYNNLVDQMRLQFGDQFSAQLMETLNLKEQALNRLISRRLMLAEARRLKLEVTREELQNAILAHPAFQTNGQYDPQRYRQTLQYLRLNPQDFEASQLEDLLMNKVERFITRGAKVLDTEVLAFYHYTRDKVNLVYVQILPNRFADRVDVDEKAIESYFEEHLESYRVAARRNIVYVRFTPDELVNEIEVTDAEVEAYYQLHQNDYHQPKKVRARHILFKLPQKTVDSQVQAVEKRAQKVLASARKGDDFADLARKHSEDTSASKGGDLGYFGRSDMVKPFADAAFSLEEGEISDLVRSRFGFHIIKVEHIQQDLVRPLAEVRESVIQSVKKDRARELAQERAESFVDETRALDDLREAAAAWDLSAAESGFFAANNAIPQLGRQPEFSELIFSLEPKEVSPVLSIREDKVVAQLLEIQDSRLPDFSEVKEAVKADWVVERSEELARKQAQEWLSSAREENSIIPLARRHGLELKRTGPITSLSTVPVLGNQRDLLVTAFALVPEQPVAPEVYEIGGTFVIVQLQAREPAPEAGFDNEKDAVARRLLEIKRQQAFRRWLTAQRQQSEVKILQEL
jgi:peptidyl-prolyl cis-trans isomerase D